MIDSKILTSGIIVDERYSIDGFLGEGGMCAVFRATQISMERTVALKVLRSSAVIDQDAIKRFQREALSIATLNHPNIIEAYGFGEHQGAPYMAIEFLEGESLADVLRRDGPFQKDRFVRICMQICDALEHAHSQGIIHRDLKPSNIMLLAGDKVKVVDFGIAKLLPESGREIQRLTQTGEIFGTPLYMSPEQFSEGVVDARSDVYALGCNMYEMLTGKPPFGAETPYEVIAHHLKTAPPQNEALGVFEGLILRCLEKNRDDRPQSAAQVKGYLHAPLTVAKRVHKPDNKRMQLGFPSTKVLLIASLIGVIVVTAWSVYQHPSDQRNKAEQLQQLSEQAASHRALDDWEQTEDSLRKALALADELHKSDIEKQSLRARLAQALFHLNRRDEMKVVAAEVRKHGDPPGPFDNAYGEALQPIGDLYTSEKNWDEGRFWFNREIRYFEKGGQKSYKKRWALSALARLEMDSGNYLEAIRVANITKEVAGNWTDDDFRRGQVIIIESKYLLAREQKDPQARARLQSEADAELDYTVSRADQQLADAMRELRTKYGGTANAGKPVDLHWLKAFNNDKSRRTLRY